MIAIGSDHGGFELKQKIIKYLEDKNIEYTDCGTYTEDSIDYPDVAKTTCSYVLNGECTSAVLICGTGIGISIAANKIDGVRAALCTDVFSAKMAKQHNNANVLCLGGRVTGSELAYMIFDTWYNCEFEGGRHQLRLDKIHGLEK